MVSLGSLLATLSDPGLIWPLVGSLITGIAIGAEREYSGKPAGLRTHTLVCFASALMTLAALRMADWTVALPANAQIVSDMSRMPHAILTGIGFLGAGVILRDGLTVQGLTTAASLWLTSALGIVFGTGLTELAILGTAIALAVLALLRVIQRRRPEGPWTLSLSYDTATAPPGDEIRARIQALGWHSTPMSLSLVLEGDQGLVRYATTLQARSPRADPGPVIAALMQSPAPRDLSLVPPGAADPG